MTRPAPACRTLAATAVAAALGLALASCGSTRFVVVQQPAAGAAAPAATTVPTEAGAAEDEAAIRKAVEGALGLDDRSFADRAPYLTGADDLEPTYQAVADLVSQVDAELKIDGVTVAGDTATATVSVTVAGEDYATGIPVEVVREDGTWKVTRGGACAALAIGSPCPDA